MSRIYSKPTNTVNPKNISTAEKISKSSAPAEKAEVRISSFDDIANL